jgi:hypothetical protein
MILSAAQMVLGVLFSIYGSLLIADAVASPYADFSRALAVLFVGFGLLFVRLKWQRARGKGLPNREVRSVREALSELPWGGVAGFSGVVLAVLMERVAVGRLELVTSLSVCATILGAVSLFVMLRVFMILRSGVPEN